MKSDPGAILTPQRVTIIDVGHVAAKCAARCDRRLVPRRRADLRAHVRDWPIEGCIEGAHGNGRDEEAEVASHACWRAAALWSVPTGHRRHLDAALLMLGGTEDPSRPQIRSGEVPVATVGAGPATTRNLRRLRPGRGGAHTLDHRDAPAPRLPLGQQRSLQKVRSSPVVGVAGLCCSACSAGSGGSDTRRSCGCCGTLPRSVHRGGRGRCRLPLRRTARPTKR